MMEIGLGAVVSRHLFRHIWQKLSFALGFEQSPKSLHGASLSLFREH